MYSRRRLLCAGLMTFAAAIGRGHGQARIEITRFAGPAATPITIAGYSGEVAEVLSFDLEVAGCRIVQEEEAKFILTGANSSQVEGRLTDRNRNNLLAKAYTGGSPRQQAHALADDVIRALGGMGVAQTKIAFKREISRWRSEIYVTDYDGANAQPLTTDGSIVAAPTWVPGRRALLYTSYRLGNPDIFAHDLSSGSRQAFSRQAGLNTSAAISPDGRRAAMILSKDGSPNLYVCNLADGSGLKRLTTGRQGESSPCWSADGQTVCFTSRASGPPLLYTVPARGGEMQRVRLVGVSNATEPDWSPDGQYLIFTTQGGGTNFEICIVAAGGGEVTRLVSGEDPSWAPNSRTVVYARRAGGVRVLSLLDVPTKQTKDLPRISGSCSQPSWAR